MYTDLISTSNGEMPYIVIDIRKRNLLSRHRRNVNCTAGVNECCREKIYISFEEIGWSDWIISPKGYNAYFCRGSCSGLASITQMDAYHSSILTVSFWFSSKYLQNAILYFHRDYKNIDRRLARNLWRSRHAALRRNTSPWSFYCSWTKITRPRKRRCQI